MRNMLDYYQDKQQLLSSSHLTVSQNIELRTLLNDCNRMACSGNLVGWRWKLDAIERELNYDLVRLDKDKNNLNAFTNRLSQNAKILKALNKRNRERFYELLSEREKILRELQEKCGKGTKRQFEESDDDDE